PDEYTSARRAASVFAREYRLPFSRLSGPGGTFDGFVPAHDRPFWGAAALRIDSKKSPATARDRAETDHPVGVCRLFFDRLGHRQFLPGTPDHGPGPGQRRQQRGLFLSWDYPSRSGEQSSRLRTFPERRAQRLARYRPRSPERGSARERDPGNLSALR